MMLGTMLIWFGALGLGIFVGLVVLLFGSEWADAVAGPLSLIAGVASWIGIVQIQQMFPEPNWLWVTLYIVCWVLNIIAGLALFLVFGRVDD